MSEPTGTVLSRREALTAVAATAATAAIAAAGVSSAQADQAAPTEAAASPFTEEQLALIGKPHPYTAVSNEPIPGTDPIPPTEAPASWDFEADVVVVGLGGGGLAVSLRCAEAGMSVLAIDKTQSIGGNCYESGAFACYGGNRYQTEELGFPPYDPEKMVWNFLSSDPTIDIPLARKYFTNMPKIIDWLEEEGVHWGCAEEAYGRLLPTSLCWAGSVKEGYYPRATGLVCEYVYQRTLEVGGVDYHFLTMATSLIKDGDRVVGVRCIDMNGTETTFHGTKAVVLTAGGFCGNPAMLQKYCPTAYRAAASSKLTPSDTGEVIRMGWGAGADISGFDKWGAFYGGIDYYAQGLGEFSQYLYSGDNQISRQPWLSFDRTGHRHVYLPFRTDQDYADNPDKYPAVFQSSGAMAMPEVESVLAEGRHYIVFDAKYEDIIDSDVLHQGGCRRPITPEMMEAPDTPDAPYVDRHPDWLVKDWRTGMQSAFASGVVKQADTLEELAELAGLEPDVMVGAVNHWNELCAAGEDPEFFYKPEFLIPLDTPPYYCMKIGMQMGQTHCGLLINDRFEVLDTRGHVIPGLYAGTQTAGNTKGFGAGNTGSWIGGYSIADTLIEDFAAQA